MRFRDPRLPPPSNVFKARLFEDRVNGYKLMAYADATDEFTDGLEEDLYWLKMSAIKRAFTANVERRLPVSGEELLLTDGSRREIVSVRSFPGKSRVMFLVQLDRL